MQLTEEWGVCEVDRVDRLGHKPALGVRPRVFALYWTQDLIVAFFSAPTHEPFCHPTSPFRKT